MAYLEKDSGLAPLQNKRAEPGVVLKEQNEEEPQVGKKSCSKILKCASITKLFSLKRFTLSISLHLKSKSRSHFVNISDCISTA